MPTKEPINTASLQQFIQQVKGADLSNQKEVRLDINTAKQVTYSLATVLARLAGDYEGLMTQKRMLINNEKYYGFTLHKVTNALDEGETISNKITKINTKDESGLLKKHKSLEHEFVYKQFVNYLLS